MSKAPTIAAVDIGTGTIKAIIVQKQADEASFRVLGMAENVSSGVRKGVVSDPEKVGKIIRVTIAEAQKEAGQEIDEVYTNINGVHLFSLLSRGIISVSRADQEISESDVERVIEAAKTFSLPQNKKIIKTISREFIIDKQKGIKNPMGLHGVRLEAEIIAMGGFVSYLKNINQAFERVDIEVEDPIINPLASARAVLTNQEKEVGVMVVDIGAGTTGVSVYEEGELLHTFVLPVGTNDLRNDIAVGLKVDPETAEFIKNKFSDSILENKKGAKVEKIKLTTGEEISFKRSELRKIAEPRIEEIFCEIGKELKKISREKALPGGVVITGGGAKIPKIKVFAREKLGLYCRIGHPRRFFPLEEDPSYSALCGIVLCGMDLEENGGKSKFDFNIIFSKIKKVFQVFIP
jgi:cell division protein FtsA